MCRDHESLNLQQFEGLVALTNLASVDDVRGRIVAEKGISCFQYLQVQQRQKDIINTTDGQICDVRFSSVASTQNCEKMAKIEDLLVMWG